MSFGVKARVAGFLAGGVACVALGAVGANAFSTHGPVIGKNPADAGKFGTDRTCHALDGKLSGPTTTVEFTANGKRYTAVAQQCDSLWNHWDVFSGASK